MNLRNQVEWALHCVGVLATLPEDKYAPAQALSTLHGVPKEYLSKALQELTKAGLLEGRLGPRGGYRLARSPDRITLLDIVEAVEGRESSFRCTEIRRNSPCFPPNQKYSQLCTIAKLMYRADAAWRGVLREMTVADLLRQIDREASPIVLQRSRDWLLQQIR